MGTYKTGLRAKREGYNCTKEIDGGAVHPLHVEGKIYKTGTTLMVCGEKKHLRLIRDDPASLSINHLSTDYSLKFSDIGHNKKKVESTDDTLAHA